MITLEELRTFFARDFPQASVTIESIGEKRASLRQPIDEQHLRPGGTVSGPTLMALADAAAYAAILATIGIVPLAVTTDLHIHFLRRPAPDKAIIAEATLLKLGRRLAVAQIHLYSEGDPAPVATSTTTYSIPPDPR